MLNALVVGRDHENIEDLSWEKGLREFKNQLDHTCGLYVYVSLYMNKVCAYVVLLL